MLAYGEEPYLHLAVEAVLASEGVQVELILVDNGCTSDAVARFKDDERLTILHPGRNTGFAGGCNLGAESAAASLLAFVNSDAIVEASALHQLAIALSDRTVSVVCSSIRLADDPAIVNSAGNPVHYCGLSWAGGLGDPAAQHSAGAAVASVSGAAMMLRRDLFEALGGFSELMFAYLEDTELSLRTWISGSTCRYVPESVVLHHYRFHANPRKMFLLERNRLILVLTVYELRTLLVLLPAFIALEATVVLSSILKGWGSQKLATYGWLLLHTCALLERRRLVQSARRLPDNAFVPLLTGDFSPGEDTGMRVPRPARWMSRAYWAIARTILR